MTKYKLKLGKVDKKKIKYFQRFSEKCFLCCDKKMSRNIVVIKSIDPSPNDNNYSKWCFIPEPVFVDILKDLSAKTILNVGECCRRWNDISKDNYLWKKIFRRDFRIDRNIELKPGAESWLNEYKRLTINVPMILTDDIKDAHNHQVLHVSFSHNGKMFATCFKDGFVILWNSSYPATVKYSHDMKKFSWKHTQFSQFNQSDTLLLVSGIHFGTSHSTSGEIAVFSVTEESKLRCRINNRPYDIFGTWLSNNFIISGNLHWLAQLVSTSVLWLNKADQEIYSEHVPITNQLYKFYNKNASSIRSIMVANCPWLCDVKKCDKNSEQNNPHDYSDSDDTNDDLESMGPKYLIFSTGARTYTPHQIGFKFVQHVNFPKTLERGPSLSERIATKKRERIRQNSEPPVEPDWLDYEAVADYFDPVDAIIDLHGHIIGMGLSPDHRYLYVHSGEWSPDYIISNPLQPPPISQEINIHVIDLTTLEKVDQIFQTHKNYTFNDHCYYIFMDVCDNYLASGAEDLQAYVWDRHYRICLAKNRHGDVVNSVAFNPKDSEMLLTTSDDYTIKIWRSINKVRELKISLSN